MLQFPDYKSSETELTAGVLKKTTTQKAHTHKGLNRTLFNQTKQDRTQFFEGILFFKSTNNTKTNCIVCGFEEEDSLPPLQIHKQYKNKLYCLWLWRRGFPWKFAFCLVLSDLKKSSLFDFLCFWPTNPMKKKQHQKHTVLVKTSAKKQKFTTQRRHHRTRPPQLFAFPQLKLFSSGRDLITSSHRSPPPAPSPALPAAGPSLLLLVGWRCRACGVAQICFFMICCHVQVELWIHRMENGTCAWTFLLLKYVTFFFWYCQCCLHFKMFMDVCV